MESSETTKLPHSLTLEWMLAADALRLLKSHFGGSVSAKLMIADLLRDGVLSCRAERVWESSEPTMTLVWKNRHEAEIEADINVSETVWQSSRFWADDLDLWRWPKNRFVVTRTRKPADRTIIEGVSLKVKEIHELLADVDLAPEKSKGGRAKKAEEWLQFWLAVTKLGRDGKLIPGTFASRAALRAKLLEMMPFGSLSEDSIKVPVRRIWTEFSLSVDE